MLSSHMLLQHELPTFEKSPWNRPTGFPSNTGRTTLIARPPLMTPHLRAAEEQPSRADAASDDSCKATYSTGSWDSVQHSNTQTLLSVAELSSTRCFNISPEAASKQAKLCSRIPCFCCSAMSKQELLFPRHENQKKATTPQNNRHDEKVDLQAGHPPGETDQSPWHCANGLWFLFPSYPPIAVSVAEQASTRYCAGRYYLWDKKEQGRLQIYFIRLFPRSL